MDAYTSFAEVYDMFMDNVPYETWGAYIHQILVEEGIEDGILLDLGCGTGKMTRLMQQYGYDMIGVDNSEEMLWIAREKEYEKQEEESGILYLLQDMREFELYGTVRAIYSACDSINYLLEEEDVLTTFRLVNNYLDPGGVFIFDVNTPYKYHTLLGDHTIAESRSEGSFIWDNYFDEETQINEYDLTLFIRDKDNYPTQDIFVRYQEEHYQRCYSLTCLKQLLAQAGLSFVAAYDAYTKLPVNDTSERITIIAKEIMK